MTIIDKNESSKILQLRAEDLLTIKAWNEFYQ